MRRDLRRSIRLVPLILSVILAVLAPQQATAQRVTPPDVGARAPAKTVNPWVFDPSEPTVLRLRGDIVPGAAVALEAALADNPGITTLVLRGEGTSQSETIAIARRVRDLGLTTRIDAGDYCHLACGIIFLAGPERRAEGILCVAVLFADTTDLDKAQLDLADFIELVMSFDLTPDLLSSVVETAAGGVYCFSPHEIARFGVDEPVVDAPAGWDARPYAVLYEKPGEGEPRGAPWPSYTAVARWSLEDGANGPEVRLVAEILDLGVAITVTVAADPPSIDPDSRGTTVTLRAETPPDFHGGGVKELIAAFSRAIEATAGLNGYYNAEPTGAPQEFSFRFEGDLAWQFARVHFARRWLSFIIGYENGADAELLVEVGEEGRAVFDQAFAAWDGMTAAVPTKPAPGR